MTETNQNNSDNSQYLSFTVEALHHQQLKPTMKE
jgi:hypothetical protein